MFTFNRQFRGWFDAPTLRLLRCLIAATETAVLRDNTTEVSLSVRTLALMADTTVRQARTRLGKLAKAEFLYIQCTPRTQMRLIVNDILYTVSKNDTDVNLLNNYNTNNYDGQMLKNEFSVTKNDTDTDGFGFGNVQNQAELLKNYVTVTKNDTVSNFTSSYNIDNYDNELLKNNQSVLKNDTDMTELPKNAVFDDVTVQLRQKTTQFCETPSVDISAFYGDEMLKSTQFENTDFSDDFKKEKKTKEKKKKETKEVPPTPPSRKKINKEKNKEEKNKEEENIYIYTKENFQKNCTEKRTAEHRENCDDKLWQWLQRCAPYIADNFEHLMTTEEKDYLASRYSQQLVTDTILAIENRRDKRQNYTNLYTTLLEWLPKMNMRYD